nr:hypothetical protein StreXyl84_29870 [Streptomyces sp. Xyl84]
MTTQDGLRLLPWSGLDGKPCYLSSSDPESYMSRLADDIESVQLDLATALLEQAHDVLEASGAESVELRLLAARLAGALGDALRVAASRGDRLR